MHEDELTALIAKTAALMERFERCCVDIDHRLRALSQALQQLTQQVPGVIRQSADGMLSTLPGALLNKVEHGLEQPVDAYEQRLRQAGGHLHDGSQALAAQIRRMEYLHKLLVWKIAGVVLGSVLLLLAGGAWLSMHYYGVIRDHQIAADLLKAYDAADVILCEDRLCVNVDPEGKRYGDAGQYVPARPR